MKLSLSLLLATLASTASASKTVSASNAAKVLRAARRVEDAAAADEAAYEETYDYLAKYSLKLIGCKKGLESTDADSGEVEYNSAIFRLCPTESGCSSDKKQGCDKGYGDFVVGLNTFVNAYFEDQRDNMQWDDQFQVDRYTECAEYKMDKADDDTYANSQFFIGPTCTDDELDVKLGFFTEETCSTASDVSFETISNGWTMPYSSGGLVSNYCSECTEYDENEAAYNLRDMCLNLYQGASLSCEKSMEYFSYYGQNVEDCDTVKASMPASIKKSGGGGKVFGWILFCLVVAGGAGYVVWWRKKKQASAGLVA